ncbi:MAG: DUF4007 family protein [Verrucomicrobia bacterium]|nr:DUF4007 family protein [Verrucomicrobiota bacterium]MBT6425227.1 DUF4007 family protein [Bacteroidetes Order II. bacterium]
MAQSRLLEPGYKPQFSGHETFPLRYGWLKKAFDAVSETEDQEENKYVFAAEDAIARFGVGKNMVSSIRHWAVSAKIIETPPTAQKHITTKLGQNIFDNEHGLDPFMEHPSTGWVIHWNLSSHTEKTTWFWAFNHFHSATFDREQLVLGLSRVAQDRAWSRAATGTIKRDVECFLRSYAVRPSTGISNHEETLECPLAELGLIKPIGRRDGFRFVRGAKASLEDGVFLYALADFWKQSTSASTLSFETIAYEPGSPGQVFLLDENELSERLLDLENITDGAFRWSETAGLKQVVRHEELSNELLLRFIELAYPSKDTKRAA